MHSEVQAVEKIEMQDQVEQVTEDQVINLKSAQD